jgi:hypothetical protein
LTIGILLSCAAAYFQSETTLANAGADRWNKIIQMPLAYYVCHAGQILFLTLTGLLAFLRYRNNRYKMWFCLYVIVGLEITVRTFSLADWLSPRVVHPTGVYGCVISLVIFIGADRRNWRIIAPLFDLAAAFFSIVVLYGLTQTVGLGRWEACNKMGTASNCLFFPAAWLVLTSLDRSRMVRWICWIPLVVFALAATIMQKRIDFVMMAFIMMFYSVLKYRSHPAQEFLDRAVRLAAGGLAVGIIAMGIWHFAPRSELLQNSVQGFKARLGDDTRSDQLVSFFADVQPSELVFGRGACATWRWYGRDYTAPPDVGYLGLLFFGGLPLLITYVPLHIGPIWVALRRKNVDLRSACAFVALLWAIRMFSSTAIEISVMYIPVLLCVGGAMIEGLPVTRNRSSARPSVLRTAH